MFSFKNKRLTITVLICTVIVIAVIGFLFIKSAKKNGDEIIALVGSEEITRSEYEYFYYKNINEYLNTTSLDQKQSLSDKWLNEKYSDSSNLTWYQMFRQKAIDEIVYYNSLFSDAETSNFTLSDTDLLAKGQIFNEIYSNAMNSNMSLEEYIRSNFGNNSEFSIKMITDKIFLAKAYLQHISNSFIVPQQQIDEYYSDNKNNTDKVTYYVYTFYGKNAKENAKKVLAASKDAETFYKETKKYIPDENKENYPASHSLMNTQKKSNIADEKSALWLFDLQRKTGDKTIIENKESFTVIMYVSRKTEAAYMVDARHILFGFSSEKPSAIEKNELKAKAEIVYLQASKNSSEDAFIKLSDQYNTDTATKNNGGLYKNIISGQMAAEFNTWCFEETRKTGDLGFVETKYGYHIIYFIKKIFQAEDNIKQTMLEDFIAKIKIKYPMKELKRF